VHTQTTIKQGTTSQQPDTPIGQQQCDLDHALFQRNLSSTARSISQSVIGRPYSPIQRYRGTRRRKSTSKINFEIFRLNMGQICLSNTTETLCDKNSDQVWHDKISS